MDIDGGWCIQLLQFTGPQSLCLFHSTCESALPEGHSSLSILHVTFPTPNRADAVTKQLCARPIKLTISHYFLQQTYEAVTHFTDKVRLRWLPDLGQLIHCGTGSNLHLLATKIELLTSRWCECLFVSPRMYESEIPKVVIRRWNLWKLIRSWGHSSYEWGCVCICRTQRSSVCVCKWRHREKTRISVDRNSPHQTPDLFRTWTSASQKHKTNFCLVREPLWSAVLCYRSP